MFGENINIETFQNSPSVGQGGNESPGLNLFSKLCDVKRGVVIILSFHITSETNRPIHDNDANVLLMMEDIYR